MIFRTNPKYILLNPTKRELSQLSQDVLQQINIVSGSSLNVNQWQNSSKVIKWFKILKTKTSNLLQFLIFKNFIHITENLLKDLILFAQTSADISSNYIEVTFHSRTFLLFNDNEPWIKKDGNGDFDVILSSHDGAKVCDRIKLTV